MLPDALLALFKVVHQTQGFTTITDLYRGGVTCLISTCAVHPECTGGVTPLSCCIAGDRDRVWQRVSEFVSKNTAHIILNVLGGGG